LLGNRQLESLGKIQLQPFYGDPIEADWVKLSVAQVRMSDQSDDNSDVVIDCAVVSNLNESMILTADVIARLSRNEQNQLRDDVSSDDIVVPVSAGTVVDNNVESPVDVIDDNDQSTESDSNDDDDDVVTDPDLASRDEIAREQRDDETLKGCFSLAKAGKGGFLLYDGLLYRRKTVMGESYLQLVVPLARRKHVLELGHSVCGGHNGSKTYSGADRVHFLLAYFADRLCRVHQSMSRMSYEKTQNIQRHCTNHANTEI